MYMTNAKGQELQSGTTQNEDSQPQMWNSLQELQCFDVAYLLWYVPSYAIPHKVP